MDIIRVPGGNNVIDSGQRQTDNIPNPWHSDTFSMNHWTLYRSMEREDPEAKKLCLMCDEVATRNCNTCDALYCSGQCFQSDLQSHRAICSQLIGEFHDCQRPDGQHFRVLFFPQNEEEPRFLWLKCAATDEELQKTMHRIIIRDCEFQPRVPTFTTETRAITINHAIPDRRCGQGLRLNSMSQMKHYDGKNGGPVINKALARLSPAGHTSVVFGPAILWSYHYKRDIRNRNSLLQPMDVGARDLRSLMDYMQGQMTNPCVVEPVRHELLGRPDILPFAVKVNCVGDVQRFQRILPDGVKELPVFEEVCVVNSTGDPWIKIGWAKVLGRKYSLSLSLYPSSSFRLFRIVLQTRAANNL